MSAFHDPNHRWVAVCMGTGCMSMASAELREALREEMDKHNLIIGASGEAGQVEVRRVGCFGFCELGPIVVVHPKETVYTRVKASDVKTIVEEHVIGGRRVGKLLYRDPVTHVLADTFDKMSFYGKQRRIVLHNVGLIDPENIDHCLAQGGYQALGKALTQMTPEGVIDVVSKAGLRGRGGAGFPTATKWKLARQAAGHRGLAKYVICNADKATPVRS